MSLIAQALIALLPVLVVTTATAIYLNRRRSNKLYQRLFGLSHDPADDGYIPEMNNRVESIDKNVRELNHDRIDKIEDRLNTLQDSITVIDKRLSENEESDDSKE